MSGISRQNFVKGLVLTSLAVQSKFVFSLAQQSGYIPAPQESGYIPTKGGKIWYRINGKEHFAKGKTPLQRGLHEQQQRRSGSRETDRHDG